MESDPPKKSTTIDDLPNELLTIIFEQLKIRDLIQCSSVSRRFKLICSHVKIPELIITKKIENFKDLWFYTNKQFNHQDAIDVTTFCRYRSVFGLDKLKRFFFKGSKPEYDHLDVDNFTQLEQIRIDIDKPVYDESTFHIDLGNLKIAEIYDYYDTTRFHVTAPKLEMLKCERFLGIDLVYPNTIKYLEVTIYDSEITQLTSLQFIQCHLHCLPYIESTGALSVLPELETIALITRFYPNCAQEIYIFDNFTHKQSLLDLVQQKRNLHRFALKIYIDCVEVEDIIEDLHSYHSPLRFQIVHYNILRGNIVDITIDYNELMDLVEGEIPDDFFKKYFKTQLIRVTKNVENPEHLFRFLNSFDYLYSLYLDCNSLDQSFYDSLGKLCQLSYVTIKNSSASISNFDFLLKLKLLERFETDSDSPNIADLILGLFSSLTHFRSISFVSSRDTTYVTKEMPGVYRISGLGVTTVKVDFNGLISELETYRKR